MRSAQLGPWLLAGLIVGPVLGSGIIILPPVVLGVAGAWALPAWLVMIAVGVVFALVFGELSVLFPGDGGVSVAVGHAFGPQGRRLASLYLVVAVLFGPVAVLLTGVRYLPLGGLPPVGVACGLLVVCAGLLLRQVASLGRVALVLSSVSAGLLFAGGVATLGDAAGALWRGAGGSMATSAMPGGPMSGVMSGGLSGSMSGAEILSAFTLPAPDWAMLGHALLLLFWIVVGWEVVGNYSAEVRNPRRTIRKAVIRALAAVTAVDLAVAGGMQWLAVRGAASPVFGTSGESGALGASASVGATGTMTVTNAAGAIGGIVVPPDGVAALLTPLFGTWGGPVLGALALALCATTYLMFVGGVARLAASLGADGILPRAVGLRARTGAPAGGIGLLCGAHVVVLAAVGRGVIDVTGLVALADGFLLANALCGVLTGVRLLRGPLRWGAAILALVLGGVLAHAAWWVLGVVAGLAVWMYRVRIGNWLRVLCTVRGLRCVCDRVLPDPRRAPLHDARSVERSLK
ncbi:amino acid permease [Nitratidesulfovibrio liaohensis]|uniref:Amino acid permease n=1 Tax=Nitratidesulfovibrio liaohensis TaxID=2604158 RepID=A0ABY9R0T9_9BACT|nr:amino acid permease [Nitratidesulfovibrio liaohensis]WMW64807.1 amino acid permease [Nitratidesulfovibrio liaohensis]